GSITEARLFLERAEETGRPYDFFVLDHRATSDEIWRFVDAVRRAGLLKDTQMLVLSHPGTSLTLKSAVQHGTAAFLINPVLPDARHSAFRILRHVKEKGLEGPPVTRYSIAEMRKGGITADRNVPQAAFHGLRVLVVEDMKINLMLMV